MKMKMKTLLTTFALVMIFSTCAYAKPLAGTSWHVVSYNNGKQAVATVIAGSSMTVHFRTDGTMYGLSGCNDYTTSYRISGEKISIKHPASTRKMCASPAGVMEQEAAFLNALERAARFEIRGDKLDIFQHDGHIAVSLKSAHRKMAETYKSGSVIAVVEMETPEEMYMTIGDETFYLVSAMSASGARYTEPGNEETEFWSKGDSAMIKVRGKQYPDEFRLVKETPIQDQAGAAVDVLTGVEWNVVRIAGKPVIPGSSVTINFGNNGKLFGKGSVNSYMSSWLTVDDRIIIDGAASTMMAGAPNLMEQEQLFLSTLDKVRRYEIKNGDLILKTVDGKEIVAKR